MAEAKAAAVARRAAKAEPGEPAAEVVAPSPAGAAVEPPARPAPSPPDNEPPPLPPPRQPTVLPSSVAELDKIRLRAFKEGWIFCRDAIRNKKFEPDHDGMNYILREDAIEKGKKGPHCR